MKVCCWWSLLCFSILPVLACTAPVSEDVVNAQSEQIRPELEQPDREVRIPVEVELVRRDDVTETLDLTGTVRPWDKFAISAEIDGRIEVIKIDEGDWITEGQLLLELDRSKRELTLRSRKAQLKKAEVELEFARRRLERAQALLGKGAISLAEVDAIAEQVALAESSLQVAKVEIETIEEDLRDTVIRSPATGQVALRSVSIGEYINASRELFQVIQLEPVKVVTEIAESYLREVVPGDMVSLEFDAVPEREFSGRVHRIHPVANPESGGFPVEIELKNRQRLFRSGMVSRIRLSGKEFKNALVVPLESILNSEGEDFVFVVEAGVARRTTVAVVERVEGLAVVRADLEPGQKVVVRGNNNLIDGSRVDSVEG